VLNDHELLSRMDRHSGCRVLGKPHTIYYRHTHYTRLTVLPFVNYSILKFANKLFIWLVSFDVMLKMLVSIYMERFHFYLALINNYDECAGEKCKSTVRKWLGAIKIAPLLRPRM
jgi:hypothetical protein